MQVLIRFQRYHVPTVQSHTGVQAAALSPSVHSHTGTSHHLDVEPLATLCLPGQPRARCSPDLRRAVVRPLPTLLLFHEFHFNHVLKPTSLFAAFVLLAFTLGSLEEAVSSSNTQTT